MGQTSSFKTGLAVVSAQTRAVGLLSVDSPLSSTHLVDLLLDEMRQKECMTLIPISQGKKGHPPFFNTSLNKEMLELTDDTGLSMISRRHE